MKYQNTKVYSINMNNNVFTKKFLGNLAGKNVIKTSKGEHIISSADVVIKYGLLDEFSQKEIEFLESQLLEACELTRKSIMELKSATIKSLEAMTDVFLRYDDEARNIILKKYSEIYDVLLGKMSFKRKAVFEDKGRSLDYVYISTNPEERVSTIYDKFFEHDEYFEKIFTRSTLLIHEASHLTGLREEAGSDIFLNAENYRKFICLLNDIATFDELYPHGNAGKTLPLKSNIGRKEFPNPDQPRNSEGKWEKKYKVTFSKTDKYDPRRNFVEDIDKGTSIKLINENDISEIWAANDIKIEGFKPNSNQTIVLSVTYEYFRQKNIEGENVEAEYEGTKNFDIAYDYKSDANGNIVLERVGLANLVDTKIDMLSAQVRIYTYEGRVSENFKEIEKVQWNSGKDKLGVYLVSHASDLSHNNLKYKNTDNYGGGLIKNFKPAGSPIYEGTIRIK
ncbi:MAG: hypothetical protein IJI37_01535 [Opitutales bacterium]|nr:hypothetical protein [Opitutales bacterium]